MAVTGIILFGFVLGHMIGNLKLYEPGVYCPSLNATGTCSAKEVPYLDAYGAFLRQIEITRGQALVAGPKVRRCAERIGADEDAALGPPERDLLPGTAAPDGYARERTE